MLPVRSASSTRPWSTRIPTPASFGTQLYDFSRVACVLIYRLFQNANSALRQEIEELRAKLAKANGTGGAPNEEEVLQLKEQLAQSQKIIADINK